MLEYEKAFQPTIEKGASLNLVLAEDANLSIALDTLVDHGVIVGQAEMLSADVIYYLNPEKENTQIRPIGGNGKPMYDSPQDRLQNRPPNTREGQRALDALAGIRPVRVMETRRPAGWGQTITQYHGRGGWS